MEHLKWQSLDHYLLDQGLINASDELILKAKKEYVRLYQKHYRAKSNKKQLNILIDKKDFNFLEKRAQGNGMKKASKYVLHLIQRDKEKESLPVNLFIDIEVGLLKAMDSISRRMGAKPKMRAELMHIYQQLQEIVKLLSF